MPDIYQGGDNSAASLYFLPAIPGTAYINYFGDDAAKTGRNLITGGAQGAVIGTPTVGAGFVTFAEGASMVRTGVLDRTAVTLIAVARPNVDPSTGGFRWIIGSFKGGNGQSGSNLFYPNAIDTAAQPNAGSARSVSGSDTFKTVATPTSANPLGWGFLVARIDAITQRIDDLTRGLSLVDSAPGTRLASNGEFYRIGSSAANLGGGKVDIAFAAIVLGLASDAQVQAQLAQTRPYLATKGIVI